MDPALKEYYDLMAVCKNCGSELEPGQVVCDKCGWSRPMAKSASCEQKNDTTLGSA
jgi:uncharacterized OB-fold protein